MFRLLIPALLTIFFSMAHAADGSSSISATEVSKQLEPGGLLILDKIASSFGDEILSKAVPIAEREASLTQDPGKIYFAQRMKYHAQQRNYAQQRTKPRCCCNCTLL